MKSNYITNDFDDLETLLKIYNETKDKLAANGLSHIHILFQSLDIEIGTVPVKKKAWWRFW